MTYDMYHSKQRMYDMVYIKYDTTYDVDHIIIDTGPLKKNAFT